MGARWIAGLIVIGLGVGLLLDAQGILDFGQFIGTYWPVILILVGIGAIASRPSRPLGGILLLALGFLFLLAELGRLPGGWANYLWAIVLIIVGLAILSSRRPRRKEHVAWNRMWKQPADGTFRYSALFSGIDETVRGTEFRGGTIEAAFGGAKVDLREAGTPVPGARLDLSATFGGVEVLLPTTWNIRLSARPMLGGVENKASSSMAAGAPVVEIHASAAFGGVTLRN